MSSILYRCESWLATSLKPIDLTYRTLVTVLLGVRPNIAIDLCLVELGMPSLVARVKSAQKNFLSRLLYSREHIADDMFMEIWKICVNAQTKGAKYLTQLLSTGNIIQEDLENRKQKCLIVLEVMMIVAMEQNLEHMFI